VFNIKAGCKNACPIWDLSCFSKEKEILFPPYTPIECVKIWKEEDFHFFEYNVLNSNGIVNKYAPLPALLPALLPPSPLVTRAHSATQSQVPSLLVYIESTVLPTEISHGFQNFLTEQQDILIDNRGVPLSVVDPLTLQTSTIDAKNVVVLILTPNEKAPDKIKVAKDELVIIKAQKGARRWTFVFDNGAKAILIQQIKKRMNI